MSDQVSASAPMSAPAPSTPTSSTPSSSTQANAGSSPVNSGQNGFDNKPATQAGSEQPANAPRKLGAADMDALVEIRVNGQVKELPLKEAIKIKQLQDASYAKMNEAAQSKKQAEQLLQMFKTDPEQFAKITGIDLDTFSEERLARKYEIQQMSPEQRELMQAKQQVDNYRKMDLQSKQSLLDEVREITGEQVPPEVAANIPKERIQQYLSQKKAEIQQHQTNFEGEFLSAWKETGLPNDPMFGQWVAAEMLNHQRRLNSGKMVGDPLQAKDAAVKVKSRLTNSVRSMFSQMDAQAIQEFLGKDIVQKLIDQRVGEVSRANDPLLGNQSKSPGQTQPASEKKALGHMEWRARMGIV